MTEDDLLFDACTILESAGINYWICHGTLLGIVREGRILPWDHDIDIGVWSNEVTKSTILGLFSKNGYVKEDIDEDNQCLHLIKSGKFKVDINFYEIIEDRAVVRWVTLKLGISYRIISKFAEGLSRQKNGFTSQTRLKSIGAQSIWYVGRLVAIFISKNIAENWINKIRAMGRDFVGYSYPVTLMQAVDYQYKNRNIRIPENPHQVLLLTYGEDWKVPKRSYKWEEDANNLYR